MKRKEKVLSYIRSPEYIPLKISELMIVLDVPAEDTDELIKILDELCTEGKILKTKRGKYEANKGAKVVTGKIVCNPYNFFAYLIPDEETEEKVFISGDYLNTALHGDRVSVKVDGFSQKFSRYEGKVATVLERANQTVVGVIKKQKNGYYQLRPDSPRIYTNIRISEENIGNAQVGDRVISQTIKFTPEAEGIVINILGDANDLKTNTDAILFTENIQTEFSEPALLQAESISDKVLEQDLSDRLDLREKLIFTIDGDDARDFDDAVSLETLPNGNYSLGVHIADVTHYVTENSPLDSDAFKRGTSVYLPDRVIPMLPEKLSNGICSLNPNVDRLTLSVIMEISPDGRVIGHELQKSVINSKERMTYSKVTELLTVRNTKLLDRYAHLVPTLKEMEKLSLALRNRRQDRGSIDFDFPEAEIKLNKKGEPYDIVRAERGISHKIIEDFMLIANETVAEYAFWAEIPFVYRVHEPPTAENMRSFQQFISAFGVGIKEKFSDDEPIHPKTLQQVLSTVKGMEEEHMIAVFTLRSLMKAEYKAECLGHFGLAAKYYCHFTSPIRRYPDLAIHRILKAFISGKSLDAYERFAVEASKHSSETERKAEFVERDARDLMKTYFMSMYIGYVFEATISSVTDFGFFAELENTVEGLVRMENLKDDFYEYDENRRVIVGRHNGVTYKIGDKIEIAVARCDIMTRQIDFIPAEDATMSDIDALQKQVNKKKKEQRKKIKKSKNPTSRKRKR